MASGIKQRFVMMICTSGSHDYLEDTTRRFWDLRTPGLASSEVPFGAADREFIDKLLAMSEEALCDGLHDEGASSQYLCTRCFPHGQLRQSDEDQEMPEEDGDLLFAQDEDQELA